MLLCGLTGVHLFICVSRREVSTQISCICLSAWLLPSIFQGLGCFFGALCHFLGLGHVGFTLFPVDLIKMAAKM